MNGVRPNLVRSNGQSALHLAVMNPDFVELIDLLLKHGANVDIEDEDGVTPLFEASTPDIVKVWLAVCVVLSCCF